MTIEVRLEMDLGIIIGLISLVAAGFSLWHGWRSENTTRESLEELRKSLREIRKQRDREAGRVDKMISALTEVLKNLSKGAD